MTGLKRYLVVLLVLFTLALPFLFYSSGLKARQDLTALEKVLLAVSQPIDELFRFSKMEILGSFESYILLADAKEEANQLREENARLSVNLQVVRELERENERLRSLLNFSKKFGSDYLAAHVLTRDPSYLFESVRIDRGWDDGIRTGMAVVAAQGAVGLVMKTLPSYSHVLLLTDPNLSLDVIVSRNRKRGVLQGRADSNMFLKHVGKGSKVQVGDLVTTSGLTGAFPRGILVGEVVQVELESDNVTQKVEVAPSVDLGDLSEVLVIRRQNPELNVIRELGGPTWMDGVLDSGDRNEGG